MEQHQLRREIVVTQIVNQLVNNAGITYFHRLAGETNGDHGRADPGQLRGARDLRRRPPAAPDLLLRQPARRRGADAHAAGEPHAGRARLALAAEQPPHRRGHRVGGRRLRGRRGEGDGRAAVADGRARARRLRAAARRAGREGRAGGPRRPGGGVPAGVHDPRHGRDRRPRRPRPDGGRARALRGRRAARPAAAGRRGSWRCRATTAGRRWPAPRCATTCTPCTPSSPPPSSPATRRRRRRSRRRCATLQEICSDEDTDLARLSVALRVVRTLL